MGIWVCQGTAGLCIEVFITLKLFCCDCILEYTLGTRVPQEMHVRNIPTPVSSTKWVALGSAKSRNVVDVHVPNLDVN